MQVFFCEVYPPSSHPSIGIDEAWILNRFPTTSDEFNTSAAQKILSQLSVYFQFTPTSVIDLPNEERPVDERPDKRRAYYRQLVKDAPEALSALTTRLSHDDPPPSANTTTKMSQKQMKQARRAAAKASIPLDPAPFERLDIPVPETRAEVEVAMQEILANQEAILEASLPEVGALLFTGNFQAYLKALHGPELAASLRTACLPEEPVLPLEPRAEAVSNEIATVVSQNPNHVTSGTLYPATQLIKLCASHFHKLWTPLDRFAARGSTATMLMDAGNGGLICPRVESVIYVSTADATAKYSGSSSRRSSTIFLLR